MNWTRQPQTFTGFSPRYPRPRFCYVPTFNQRNDIVGGLTGAAGSGESCRPAQKGVSYRATRQANGGLNFASQQAITSETFTVLLIANQTSQSTGQEWCVFNQRQHSSPEPQFRMYFNATRAEVGSAGKFAAYVYNSGYSSTDTDGTYVDGAFHVWAATRNGTTNAPVLWVDGAKPAQTSSVSTLTMLASSQSTRIGNIANISTTFGCDADVPLCVCWNSVLPDTLMAELGRNPWQLFNPLPARVYAFPVTATGGTIPLIGRGPGRSLANIGGGIVGAAHA